MLQGQAGPVYLVSVAGSRMHGTVPERRRMDRLGLNTQFNQVITIDGGKLEFRTYTVMGKPCDSFDLVKRENSFNPIVEQISSDATPENVFPGGAYNRKNAK